MKKFILLLVMSLSLLITGSVYATSFTFTHNELLAIDYAFTMGGSTIGPLTIADLGLGVIEFSQTLDDDPTDNGSYTAHVLGYSDTSSLSFGGDLSTYDEYTLDIQNVDDELWAVNIFISDNGGQTYNDLCYDTSAWVWLSPGETAYFSLDLITPPKPVDLENITNIGFIVTSQFIGGGYGPLYKTDSYPSDPGTYNVDVNSTYDDEPIPEPSTILFLGTGILSFATFLKGRKVRKI